MKRELTERFTGRPTSNEICGILHTVYQAQRPRFEAGARSRGISLEALAAAAIAGMLAERLSGSSTCCERPQHRVKRRITAYSSRSA